MLRKWLHVLLPLMILLIALIVRLVEPVAVVNIRNMVFDTYQRIHPRPYSPVPVRIVDLDDASMEQLGQWPWPRTVVAELVARLANLGAAVIAFDMVFSEPDRTSPQNIIPLWAVDEEFAAAAESLADHDAILGDVIAQTRVVTGFALTNGEITRSPALKGSFAIAGDNPRPFIPGFSGSVVNLPEIEVNAAGNGSFNMLADSDGLVRRVPLLVRIDDQLYPTLAAEVIRVVQGAQTYIVRASGASGEESFGQVTGVNNIRIGSTIVPTDANGAVYLHFTEPEPARYVPAWTVFNESVDPNLIAGNIILIGTSAAGLQDQRATPLNPVIPGVEIHAQLVEMMTLELAGGEAAYLLRPDWASGAEIIYLIALGLLLIFVLPRWGAMRSAIFGVTMIGLAIYGSWYAFTELRFLLDPVFPSVVILFIYIVESLMTYLKTEAEKEQVRGAFQHYLSPALVEQLAENPDQLRLGGETRQMTLMFSDIRGFTTISESFDAEGLTSFINKFLTPMTDIILSTKGTVDKYMGDCIMAFWNAPLDDEHHARHAAYAALQMKTRLAELNQEWKADAEENDRKYVPVKVGIGLNTGDCCVGNMGSAQRFDYSVLGDDVNLASRLEGQAKTYGMDIILGENTRNQIADMALIELDLIQVKGKTVPIRIYALMGDEDIAALAEFKELLSSHEKFLQNYREQNWDFALSHIAQYRQEGGGQLDKLYALYEDRINEFKASPPGQDWAGVYVAVTK